MFLPIEVRVLIWQILKHQIHNFNLQFSIDFSYSNPIFSNSSYSNPFLRMEKAKTTHLSLQIKPRPNSFSSPHPPLLILFSSASCASSVCVDVVIFLGERKAQTPLPLWWISRELEKNPSSFSFFWDQTSFFDSIFHSFFFRKYY